MTDRNEHDEGSLLTREKAAEVSGLSLSTIDRYLADGTLPKRKIGKRFVRIARVDLDRLLGGSPAAPTRAVAS